MARTRSSSELGDEHGPHASAYEASPFDGLDAQQGEGDPPDSIRDSKPRGEATAPVPRHDDHRLRACLAAIAQQRDQCALADLYRATASRVHGLALKIVRDVTVAEEVTADTYWQVWRQADRFDAQRGCALAWIMTMARSRALDAWRARARMQSDTVSIDSLGLSHESDLIDATDGAGKSPCATLAWAQAERALHQALRQIEPMQRQLLAMAFFKGLTHEEIATQTGLPLGTVKSHVRRGLLALRTCLSQR